MGGAERVLISLLRPWTTGEFQDKPIVVCIEDGPIIGELARLNITSTVREVPPSIRRLGDSPARKEGRLTRIIRMTLAIPSLIRVLVSWKKWFRREAPAWVHSNGFKTHILSAWSAPGNIPIFWHLHDFVGERPLVRKLLKAVWRPGIRALAISKSVAEDFSRVLPQCPVDVWYNTINCEVFKPGKEDGAWLDGVAGLGEGFHGLRVGLVATYARWKGQEVFLQACAKLAFEFKEKVRFYVVGGPVYQAMGSQWSEAELREIIRDLGLGGIAGLVPFQKDTARVYQSLDVVVHASTLREPFGLVIAEAMACGKPVVAALHGGAAEIGRDSVDCVGHVPGDAASLAAAIGHLIKDESRRQELGARARARILADFGPEKNHQKWQELIGEIRIN
jgi:glycosyltransferase involved in cell wall biosynthesis